MRLRWAYLALLLAFIGGVSGIGIGLNSVLHPSPTTTTTSTTPTTESLYSCTAEWTGTVDGYQQTLEACQEASAPSMAEWCLVTGAVPGVASFCWSGNAP